jgi:hypothetical protein
VTCVKVPWYSNAGGGSGVIGNGGGSGVIGSGGGSGVICTGFPTVGEMCGVSVQLDPSLL